MPAQHHTQPPLAAAVCSQPSTALTHRICAAVSLLPAAATAPACCQPSAAVMLTPSFARSTAGAPLLLPAAAPAAAAAGASNSVSLLKSAACSVFPPAGSTPVVTALGRLWRSREAEWAAMGLLRLPAIPDVSMDALTVVGLLGEVLCQLLVTCIAPGLSC